jgi:hypothetical protein
MNTYENLLIAARAVVAAGLDPNGSPEALARAVGNLYMAVAVIDQPNRFAEPDAQQHIH